MCAPIVQWIAIVLSVTFLIDNCVDRLCAEGARDSASWLMCGDTNLLFLLPMDNKPGCVQS